MKSREYILDILYRVFKDNAYASILLRKIDDESISFISEVVYGTLRNYSLLEYQWKDLAKKTDLKTSLILDMSVYQLFLMDNVPEYAVINEAVELANKHQKGFVNAILHKVIERGFIHSDDLSVEMSHPEWLIKLWIAHYGEDITKQILEKDNDRATVYARINTLKITKEELEKNSDITFIDDICFISKTPIASMEEFKERKVIIQDINSQKVVKFLPLKEGDRVLDLCSAPGTKSEQIAEVLKDNGEIIACDLYEHRCKLIDQLMDKCGVTSVKSMVNDATIANFEEESFDCILMDVPCSGLGDLAHKPEIKWHTTSNDLDEIVNIQASILENNWKAVKKEGYIVYSTCTLNKKENDKQISNFLSKHEEMTLIKEETIFPFMNNGDGFYVALMQRIG